MKKIIPFLLFLIFIVLNVNGEGLCVLDKQNYHPGETALFSCSCSLPIEESQSGFIVFRNSSGTVLQSNAIDSGLCRTSLFSGSYFFLTGQDFLGNATFSLNANGTGTPINWGNANDITTDDFNVSGAHTTDCIIQFENITNETFDLGRTFAVQLNLLDGITDNPLLHGNCHIHMLDTTRLSIFHIPYTPPGDVNIETGSDGEVLFQHDLDEMVWLPNTEYILEANCYCTINDTSEQCYLADGGNGEVAGMKVCTAETQFNTGQDLRQMNGRNNMVSFILSILIIVLFFGLIGFIALNLQSSKEKQKLSADKMNTAIMFISWSMVIMEIILMIGVIYMNQLNADLTGLFYINFWVSAILGFGLGMIVLTMITLSLFDFSQQAKSDGFSNKGW